jgi:hypothetical protein
MIISLAEDFHREALVRDLEDLIIDCEFDGHISVQDILSYFSMGREKE